jgi:hypothetical protein
LRDTAGSLILDTDAEPILTTGVTKMAVLAHVGENGVAEVLIYDATGAQTSNWDKTGGITYSSSNPAAVTVVDDDANPQDARVEFLVVTHQFNSNTGEVVPDPEADVFINVSFDGRVGPDVSTINLRSEAIQVVEGEATSGEVIIRFEQVPPAA